MIDIRARLVRRRRRRNIERHRGEQMIHEARIRELRVAIDTYLDCHWPSPKPVVWPGAADDMARWIYGQCLWPRPHAHD